MRDGFELVARIPYPVTEPKHLLIANEVATLDYMRASKLSVPQVYGYSTTPDNPARTEYILMEFIQGTNLGDIWFNLGERERIFVVRRLVDFESRLFALNFAASGSLFYEHDLDWDADRVRLDSPSPTSTRNFCVGRDMDLAMWFGKRKDLHGFRGPCE